MGELATEVRDSLVPDAWRVTLLNRATALLALTGVLILALMSFQGWMDSQPYFIVGAWGISLSGVFLALWRSGPYRVRAWLLISLSFIAQGIALIKAGFVIGTTMTGLAAIVLCGLLLGLRSAIWGWLVSSAILLVGAFLLGTGTIETNIDPGYYDTSNLRVGLRFAMVYSAFTAVIALGMSVVMNRLSDSLDETQKALDRETAARLERESAELALRTTESKWRSLVEHAPDFIVIVNREHIVEFVNRRSEGFEKQLIVGRAIESLVAKKVRAATREAIDYVFETGLTTSVDGDAMADDGTLRTFSTRLGPLMIGGEVDRVTLISTDTSDRVNLENQLRQAQKLEAVGQLTGGVAHDFNNLLTVMIGNLEVVNDQLRDAGLTLEFADFVSEAARRAAGLTHRLLAFSRRQPLRPRVVDLQRLVAGMDELLRRTLGESIEIECVTTGSLWMCEIDPGQMENVLLNLAINARDAMPTGGQLTIEVGNARLDRNYSEQHDDVAPGQYVLLAVSDTGTGMSEGVAEHAFDPFFSTKETGQGSGLGLSMIYGFVKQSGGHVKIYSEEGDGTTVKVYLPRSVEEEQDEAVAVPSRADSSGHGELILVVEDDERVRRLTVKLLQQIGYRTLEASAADEARRLFSETDNLVLLLTDVVLPGEMGGAELARQAQAQLPDLQVLFFSGYTENAILHHGRLDPGVALLEKPFTRSELALAVQSVLEGRSA